MKDVTAFSAKIDQNDLPLINDQKGSAFKTFYLNRKVSSTPSSTPSVHIYSSFNLLARIGSWLGFTQYDKSKNIYVLTKDAGRYADIVKVAIGPENSPTAQAAVAYHTFEGALKRGDWTRAQEQIKLLENLVENSAGEDKEICQEKLRRAFTVITEPKSLLGISSEKITLIHSLKKYCTKPDSLAQALTPALTDACKKKSPFIPDILELVDTFEIEEVAQEVVDQAIYALQTETDPTLLKHYLGNAPFILAAMQSAKIEPKIDTVLHLVDKALPDTALAHEIAIASGLVTEHDFSALPAHASLIAYFAFEPTLKAMQPNESHEFHGSVELLKNLEQDIKKHSPVMGDLISIEANTIKFDQTSDRCHQAMEKYLEEKNPSSKIKELLSIMSARKIDINFVVSDINFVVSMMLVSQKISIEEIWDIVKDTNVTANLNNDTFQYLIDAADLAKNPNLLLEIHHTDTKSRIDLTSKEIDFKNWSIAAALLTFEKALNETAQENSIGLKIMVRTESDLKALSHLLEERFARIKFTSDPKSKTITFEKYRTINDTRALCLEELKKNPVDALIKMRYAKIPPDQDFCTSLITNHQNSENFNNLLTLLKNLPQSTTPLIAAYTSLMNQHIASNDVESALLMFNALKTNSIELPRKETLALMRAANAQAETKNSPKESLYKLEDTLAATIPLSVDDHSIDAEGWTLRTLKPALQLICTQVPVNKNITIKCTPENTTALVSYLQDEFKEMFAAQKENTIVIKKRNLFEDSQPLNRELNTITEKKPFALDKALVCLKKFKEEQLELLNTFQGGITGVLLKCLENSKDKDNDVKAVITLVTTFRYPPSLYDCESVLKYYNDTNIARSADLIDTLLNKPYVPHKLGNPFEERILTQFVGKAVEAKSFDSLDIVLKRTTQQNNPYKEKVFNEAITLCLKHKQPDQALRIFKQFHETNPRQPLDANIYQQLLIDSSHEAESVVKPLFKDEKLFMQVSTGAALAFIEAKSFNNAQKILTICCENFPKSPYLLTPLQNALEAAIKSNQPDLIAQILSQISKMKLEETVVANLIKNAGSFDTRAMAAVLGQTNLSSEIYLPLVSSYLDQDITYFSTLNTFISALPEGYPSSLRSACEQVVQKYIKMQSTVPLKRDIKIPQLYTLTELCFSKWDLSLSRDNYSQIVEGLLNHKKAKEAQAVIQMMLEQDITPTDTQYYRLIALVAAFGNIGSAKEIIAEASNALKDPDSLTQSVIQAYDQLLLTLNKLEDQDPLTNLNKLIAVLPKGRESSQKLIVQSLSDNTLDHCLPLVKALLLSNQIDKETIGKVVHLLAESTNVNSTTQLVDLLKFLKAQSSEKNAQEICTPLLEQFKGQGLAAKKLFQGMVSSQIAKPSDAPKWLLTAYLEAIEIDDLSSLTNLKSILTGYTKEERITILADKLNQYASIETSTSSLSARLKVLLKTFEAFKDKPEQSLHIKALKRVFEIDAETSPEDSALHTFQAIKRHNLRIDNDFAKEMILSASGDVANDIFDSGYFELEVEHGKIDVSDLPTLVACKALENSLSLIEDPDLRVLKILTDDPKTALAYLQDHFPHIQFTADKNTISISSIETNPEKIIRMYTKRLQESKNDPERIESILKTMNENDVQINEGILHEAINQYIGNHENPSSVEKAIKNCLAFVEQESLGEIGPKLFHIFIEEKKLTHANALVHVIQSDEQLYSELLKATFSNNSITIDNMIETITTLANANVSIPKEMIISTFRKFPNDYARLLTAFAKSRDIEMALVDLFTSSKNISQLLKAVVQSPLGSKLPAQIFPIVEKQLGSLELERDNYCSLIEQAMKNGMDTLANSLLKISKIELHPSLETHSFDVRKLPPYTAGLALKQALVSILQPNSHFKILMNEADTEALTSFITQNLPLISATKVGLSLIIKQKSDEEISEVLLKALDDNDIPVATTCLQILKLLPPNLSLSELFSLPQPEIATLLKKIPTEFIEPLFASPIDEILKSEDQTKASTILQTIKKVHPGLNTRFERTFLENLLRDEKLQKAREFYFAISPISDAPNRENANSLLQAYINKATVKDAIALYDSILDFDEEFKLEAQTRQNFINAAIQGGESSFAKSIEIK